MRVINSGLRHPTPRTCWPALRVRETSAASVQPTATAYSLPWACANGTHMDHNEDRDSAGWTAAEGERCRRIVISHGALQCTIGMAMLSAWRQTVSRCRRPNQPTVNNALITGWRPHYRVRMPYSVQVIRRIFPYATCRLIRVVHSIFPAPPPPLSSEEQEHQGSTHSAQLVHLLGLFAPLPRQTPKNSLRYRGPTLADAIPFPLSLVLWPPFPR